MLLWYICYSYLSSRKHGIVDCTCSVGHQKFLCPKTEIHRLLTFWRKIASSVGLVWNKALFGKHLEIRLKTGQYVWITVLLKAYSFQEKFVFHIDLFQQLIENGTTNWAQSIGGSRGRAGAYPPTGPNSFVFAYIFTEKCPCRRKTPPQNGSKPPYGKSCIRPCKAY